jgi:hypothetical protein
MRTAIIYLAVMAVLILVPAGFILLSLHWCEGGYADWCFLARP